MLQFCRLAEYHAGIELERSKEEFNGDASAQAGKQLPLPNMGDH
jgi:hypothetical protein